MRLQSQIECLLEETRIKLSSVVNDLLGVSGLRILWAMARGESDPKKLATLGEERLRCSEEQLIDALTGSPQPMHRELLSLQLERLQLIDEQIARLNGLIAQALKPHQDTQMRRLAQEIITDQESEIELMRLWLRQHDGQKSKPATATDSAVASRRYLIVTELSDPSRVILQQATPSNGD